MRVTLKLHPDSRCKAVREIVVDVTRPIAGALSLRYVLVGRIDDLRLPPVQTADRTDDLWKHTCFEAFARGAGEGYVEFNFAPSTQWAVYHFSGYRSGMSKPELPAPPIETQSTGDAYELRTMILAPHDATHLGLSAVIEEKSGNKSYWALAHPRGKPDFHHLDGFALAVPAVEQV